MLIYQPRADSCITLRDKWNENTSYCDKRHIQQDKRAGSRYLVDFIQILCNGRMNRFISAQSEPESTYFQGFLSEMYPSRRLDLLAFE